MYIKIKHVKNILLVSACIFFAGFNYLTYVKADSATVDAKTCNKEVDTDCDGLTNEEESLYGTDEKKADTDGDGYSDGVEVKSGYDPAKPAPGDKILTSTNIQAVAASNTENDKISISENFSRDLQTFISSKGAQAITNSDITTFISTRLADTTGEAITIDSLPEVDSSSIHVISQDYSSLSSDKKKEQMAIDSSEYYTTLLYLIISNSPKIITSNSDLVAFNQDFLDHVASLSNTNPDYAYFSDLGERLDMLSTQLSTMSVPETMVDMHIKMIRILKGFLLLKDTPDVSDPIARMSLLSKIQALTKLSTDFLGKDVASHLNQF